MASGKTYFILIVSIIVLLFSINLLNDVVNQKKGKGYYYLSTSLLVLTSISIGYSTALVTSKSQ